MQSRQREQILNNNNSVNNNINLTDSQLCETQSVSTVSGSGMDFFRKFVQRKKVKPGKANDVVTESQHTRRSQSREMEEKFRREVLIDRLVTDSIIAHQQMRMKKSRQNGKNGQTPARDKRNSRRQDSNGQSTPFDTSETSESEAEAEVARAADINEVNDKTSVISESNPSLFTSVAAVPDSLLRLNGGGGERAKKEEKNNQDFADTQSVATVRSSMTLSTVSGSGLRFPRNYLKKKQSATATSSSSTSNANPPTLVSHNEDPSTRSCGTQPRAKW